MAYKSSTKRPTIPTPQHFYNFMNNLEQIFKNNKEWITSKLKDDPQYFENLSKGQDPDILYIGCSDSRVAAESMMGLEPGELFVHRNIANIVGNTDISALSVINYAIEHLKVKHVVICGHYYCGGVRAAMESSDLAIINPWLRGVRDVYRLHKEELNAIKDEEARYKKLAELNVQEQCINAIKIPDVQRAIRNRGLTVHGWVYDIRTGKIIDLKIDFEKTLESIMEIYRLD